MPRRSTGPKLWFDNTRETWSIVDGRRLLENNRRAFKRLLKNASHFDLLHAVHNVKAKRSNV